MTSNTTTTNIENATTMTTKQNITPSENNEIKENEMLLENKKNSALIENDANDLNTKTSVESQACDYRKLIRQTEFMLSAPTFNLCPKDEGLEVAFAGRSNAGKSSAINALTNQRQLARSSKTPGRTQMINFFSIGDKETHEHVRLVDLPGYGYAAVPEDMKRKWQVELEEYLVERESLSGLVLLTDIRRPLSYHDSQMLSWAIDGELPVHVLLTKADKLKYGAAQTALLQTRKELQKLELPCTIQLFSALKKEGLDELAIVMGNWLELAKEKKAKIEVE